MPRLERGIQYVAASRLNRRRLWKILDRPVPSTPRLRRAFGLRRAEALTEVASRAMTSGETPAHAIMLARTGYRGDQHERQSLLRSSGRGRKIRRGLWLRACDCDLLHDKPFDTLGNHPRHSGLALRDLFRIVSVNDQPHRTLSHAPRHEAANIDFHMVGPAVVDRPHHGAAGPVRLGDNRFVRHVPPLVFDPNAIVAVTGFPIRIRKRRTVGIRTARALPALEALEPWLERRAGIATIVMRESVPCESGRGEQQRREQSAEFHR